MSYEFRSTNYEFRSTSFKFRSTSYQFKYISYEFKSTSQETKSTSWKIKSTILSNKNTNQIINIRVKRENSEFKTMNFTSYKMFIFIAQRMLNLSHTKVLKNLFLNMTLKNLYFITILPSYFSSRQTQKHSNKT